MSNNIRYVHKSHIRELFIVGNSNAFFLSAKAVATFNAPINNLTQAVVRKDYLTVGGPFATVEEAHAYIAKEFPEYVATKVMVNRIVRNRWVHPKAA